MALMRRQACAKMHSILTLLDSSVREKTIKMKQQAAEGELNYYKQVRYAYFNPMLHMTLCS